jgi:hypothetical protein
MAQADQTITLRRYIVSASTTLVSVTNDAFKAFDNNEGTSWISGSGNKYTSSGSGVLVYAGSEGSTRLLADGVSTYAGEWLQVQVDSPMVLGKYTIIFDSSATAQAPREWRVLGSNDGLVWDPVSYMADGSPGPSYITTQRDFYPRIETPAAGNMQWRAFTYFRLVVGAIADTATTKEARIAEWKLYEATTVALCPTGSYCRDAPFSGSRVFCPVNTYQPYTQKTLQTV